LKNLKGILRFSFELKVSFKAEKLSFSFNLHNRFEEYLCINKENYDSLKDYFSKRLNLMGFHDCYTAIKKIGKGNFASVYTFLGFFLNFFMGFSIEFSVFHSISDNFTIFTKELTDLMRFERFF